MAFHVTSRLWLPQRTWSLLKLPFPLTCPDKQIYVYLGHRMVSLYPAFHLTESYFCFKSQFKSPFLCVMGWIVSALKFMCWSPNPQYYSKCEHVETVPFGGHWGETRSYGCTRFSMTGVLMRRDWDTEIQRGKTTWRWLSKSQGVRPWEKSALPTSWLWTSSLQNCEEINFCCLSHLV